jgi:hypothetical protein
MENKRTQQPEELVACHDCGRAGVVVTDTLHVLFQAIQRVSTSTRTCSCRQSGLAGSVSNVNRVQSVARPTMT